MRILVASNGHKQHLSAVEIRDQLHAALSALDSIDVRAHVFADGGEGTLEAIHACFGGIVHEADTHDAMLRPRKGRVLEYTVNDKKHVCIQASDASGTHLLQPEEQQSIVGSSYGVGELITFALSLEPDEIIIGLGGSSAVEGGAGMAQALGVEFLDRRGDLIQTFPGFGLNLLALKQLHDFRVPERLCTFPKVTALCDVTNPLLGPQGYATQYGHQKGLTPEIAYLDRTLTHYVEVVAKSTGMDINLPSSAACGGLAAGLKAFLNADLILGADWLARQLNLEADLQRSELLIVGEGCLDRTTAFGKTPWALAQWAKRTHTPVWVIVARQEDDCHTDLLDLFDRILIINLEKDTPDKNILKLQTELAKHLSGSIQPMARKHEAH